MPGVIEHLLVKGQGSRTITPWLVNVPESDGKAYITDYTTGSLSWMCNHDVGGRWLGSHITSEYHT